VFSWCCSWCCQINRAPCASSTRRHPRLLCSLHAQNQTIFSPDPTTIIKERSLKKRKRHNLLKIQSLTRTTANANTGCQVNYSPSKTLHQRLKTYPRLHYAQVRPLSDLQSAIKLRPLLSKKR